MSEDWTNAFKWAQININDTGLYCVIFHNIQYHSYLWKWEFWCSSADSIYPISWHRWTMWRCQSIIALYTEQDAECNHQQQSLIDDESTQPRPLPSRSVFNTQSDVHQLFAHTWVYRINGHLPSQVRRRVWEERKQSAPTSYFTS